MYDDPVHVAFIRCNQWMHAVELQQTRVLGPVDATPITPTTPPEVVSAYRLDWNARQRDIDFYVIALHRLRIAAADARKRLKDIRLRPALKDFDRAVPDLGDLRDVAEHFDSYDWSIGKLITRQQLTDEAPGYEWGADDAGITYRGKRLHLVASTIAARRLHAAVMLVVADRGRPVDLTEWPLVRWPPSST